MSRVEFVSRQEAAITLRCTVPDIDRYIALGLLPRYRVRGRYVRVRRADVAELATVDPDVLRNA
jgi:excisionase family DNA binding protein